jgi:hypothetical protein
LTLCSGRRNLGKPLAWLGRFHWDLCLHGLLVKFVTFVCGLQGFGEPGSADPFVSEHAAADTLVAEDDPPAAETLPAPPADPAVVEEVRVLAKPSLWVALVLVSLFRAPCFLEVHTLVAP